MGGACTGRNQFLCSLKAHCESQRPGTKTAQPILAQLAIRLHHTALCNGDASIKGPSSPSRPSKGGTASQTYLALVPTGPLEGLGTLRQNSHHARTCSVNCKRNRHMQPTESPASQPWESTAALFNLAETHGNTSCQAQVLKQPSPKLHNSQFSMAAAMHQSRVLAVLAGQVNVGRHLRYLALVPTGPLEGLGTLRQNSHHARTCGINCKRNRHMQPTESPASQPWESTAALFNLAETHGNTSCQAQVLKQPSPKLHNSQFSMAAAMHQSRDLAVLAGQVNVGRHLRYLALVPTGPLEGLGTLRQNSHHARTCGINCKRNRHMQPTESPASQPWELQPLLFLIWLRHTATLLARRRC